MFSPDLTTARLEAVFGESQSWTSPQGVSAMAWETPAYHLIWLDRSASEAELKRLWDARRGRTPYAVVLLAASTDDPSKVQAAGPQDARPVRELPTGRVIDLLEKSRDSSMREAASFLAREFNRLEESVVPGLRVKDLLTPHFARDRLRWPANKQLLAEAAEQVERGGDLGWRSLLQGLGYRIEQLSRGYLLRHGNAPVAVVHPYNSPALFGHLTGQGALPEGIVLAECERQGALWGILTAQGRFRAFKRQPPTGAATGQHVELDVGELEGQDWLYIGLLAPESLREEGWLTK
ncbi:MAG: hypothetical protein OXG11_12985 [Chloroflexi bacterium]|nr:hypothetical protein [Chloroflexota bacterium]